MYILSLRIVISRARENRSAAPTQGRLDVIARRMILCSASGKKYSHTAEDWLKTKIFHQLPTICADNMVHK